MLNRVFVLNDYVQSLFDNGNDSEQVATILLRRAEHNADLRKELLILGAGQAVRLHFTVRRKSSPEPIGRPASLARQEKQQRAGLNNAQRSLRAERKNNRRQFWDNYALFGHMLLRDAKASDLRESIAKRSKQVAGNQKAIRFEAAILSRLKAEPTKTCSQVLTVDKVNDIRKKFYGPKAQDV